MVYTQERGTMSGKVILGTRGSKLALSQAHIAASRLKKSDPSLTVEIKVISTAGDRNQQQNLSEIGGKGIFIKDLEQALINKDIDIAVHSFKDITSKTPSGLELCSFFSPESVCDVLISRDNRPLDQLVSGASIGTSSMRRKVLLQRLRPDLSFNDIRGNIDTRLAKLDNGSYDGIVLSEAGLIRLGLQKRITQRFDPNCFFPAPGQGVIALEARSEDQTTIKRCIDAGDYDQFAVSRAELSVLICLGFDCRTAFGVHSTRHSDSLHMSGFYVDPVSGKFIQKQVSGPLSEPEQLGRILCDALLKGCN